MVPIVKYAGLNPGLVWKDAENLAPTGIRSLERKVRGSNPRIRGARSESLYRLSYPGPVDNSSSRPNNRICTSEISLVQAVALVATFSISAVGDDWLAYCFRRFYIAKLPGTLYGARITAQVPS